MSPYSCRPPGSQTLSLQTPDHDHQRQYRNACKVRIHDLIQFHVLVSTFQDSLVAPPNPLSTWPSSRAGDIILRRSRQGQHNHSTLGSEIERDQDHLVLTDEIPILEIEAVQLIACLLRVHDILVDHKCRALGVGCYPLTYLPAPPSNMSH